MSTLPVGRRVVVIGGGMTAIDTAAQSKRLGAEDVTIVYRRGQAEMKASVYEQELAQTDGVKIMHWAPAEAAARPTRGGNVTRHRVRIHAPTNGRLVGTGETFTLHADMVFKAIGQTFVPAPLDGAARRDRARGRPHRGRRRAPHLDARRLGRRRLRRRRRGPHRRRGEDGKLAAESIHRALTGAMTSNERRRHYGADVLARIATDWRRQSQRRSRCRRKR